MAKEVKKKTEKKEMKSQEKEMSLAVIETGGKQYLVKPGDKLKVERIGKPEKGSTVIFDKVLLVAKGKETKVGDPYISGTKIKGEWSAEKRAPKVTNLKYKNKTRETRKKGHRQIYTEIIIGDF